MEPTRYINSCHAKSISNEKRKCLTIDVLKGTQRISSAAKENNVSRQFLHRLKNKALGAIDDCFEEMADGVFWEAPRKPRFFNFPILNSRL